MPSTRIKGQDVEVRLIVGSELQETITDVRSFEVTVQTEILREGYLGETSDRRDDVYRGIAGRMELHFENDDILTMMRSIIDRARRRTPGTQINIQATLNFPNGDTPVVQIPDVFFGPIPLNFGSRADFGAITLEFEATDFKQISL